MKKHAILGTDFSRAVSKIIDSASMLSDFGIEKITLVHVLNLRDIKHEKDLELDWQEEKLLHQKQELASKGFEVQTELVFGIPALELQRKGKEFDAHLTIVGSHGRTFSTSTLGGTIREVLDSIKQPVLVIPLAKKEKKYPLTQGKTIFTAEAMLKRIEANEPEWKLKCNRLIDHVLFPTDFSDFSEYTFQWLQSQVRQIKKLTLFHVQDSVKIDKHLKDKLKEFNRIDQERLDRLRNSFLKTHPETEVETKIVYGKPIKEILDFIAKNDVTLTAMGSQGRGFLAEIFLGSVSNQVARHSASNVLVVPLKRG